MRPCRRASRETSATDSRAAAAIAAPSNTLAKAETAFDGGRTVGNCLYQPRLRLNTAKEIASAGAINHGNAGPAHAFRYTMTVTRTSVPTPTRTHNSIELAMTSERAGFLDAGIDTGYTPSIAAGTCPMYLRA